MTDETTPQDSRIIDQSVAEAIELAERSYGDDRLDALFRPDRGALLPPEVETIDARDAWLGGVLLVIFFGLGVGVGAAL